MYKDFNLYLKPDKFSDADYLKNKVSNLFVIGIDRVIWNKIESLVLDIE